MSITALDWSVANQRCLARALDDVRARLEGGEPESISPAVLPASETGFSSALDRVCDAFGLSPFERDVLLLCAGAELDAKFAPAIARALGDPRRTSPTFALALATLDDAHWTALTPDGPLRRWRLIEVGAGEMLTTSPLRIDERVLHYLAGVSQMDERLRGLLDVVDIPGEVVASHRLIVDLITRAWATAPWPIVQLTGEHLEESVAVAATACGMVGVRLYAMNAVAVPHLAAECDAFIQLWRRESILGRCGLLIQWPDREALSPEHEAAVLRVLRSANGAMMLSRHTPLTTLNRPAVTFEVGRASDFECRDAWTRALGADAASLNGTVEALSSQFALSPPAIRTVCTTAIHRARAGEDLHDALWDACRSHSRPRLDEFAPRILARATWDDLVIGTGETQVLRQIAAHVRRRATVYDRWGFAAMSARGLGISALFAGPSGTGKTMAGEVLANELRLDLYRIDLSQVVSKYIGETEKNLRRVFDAAEEGNSILLFDEADALFGKRSDVKDSHDRYANVEVSYLLQRMEAFRGLAILTTNLKHTLDPAFMRRIRFVVHFPFPDQELREAIWRRVFPPQTPLDGLDYRRLARLQVAGGSIRNIAMNAAFLAADQDAPVRMPDVIAAARGEYAKLERPLTEMEAGA
jgi:hypothetical protein